MSWSLSSAIEGESIGFGSFRALREGAVLVDIFTLIPYDSKIKPLKKAAEEVQGHERNHSEKCDKYFEEEGEK